MSLNTSVIKPPKGMQTPKEPIRHLGILINNSGTADFLIEDNLLSGISTSMSKWKAQNLSGIGQTRLINTFITSRILYCAHIIPFSNSFFNKLNSGIQKFLWKKVPPVKIEVLFGSRESGGLGLIDPKKLSLKMFEKYLLRVIQHPTHSESGWHIASRIIMGRALNLASPTIFTTLSKYLSNNKGAIGPFTSPQYWRSILRILKDNKITITYSHQPIIKSSRTHTYILAKNNLPIGKKTELEQQSIPTVPKLSSKLKPESFALETIWGDCFNNCLPTKIQANTWKVLRMVYRTAERNQPSLRSCVHCKEYDSIIHRFFKCRIASTVWEKANSLAYYKESVPSPPEENWFFKSASKINSHVRSTLFSIALWTIYSTFIATISSNPITTSEIILRYICTLTKTARMIIYGFQFKKELSHIPFTWEQLPFLGTNPQTDIKWVEFPTNHTNLIPADTACENRAFQEPQIPP